MVYSRFGNTLRIFDDRTEIKLTSRDFSEEEALEGYSIFGQWQGTDLFSNVWSVIIKNEQTFEASAGNRSQQSLIISGAVQVVDSEAPKRAKLVVERTNNPDTRGMALEVVLLTADILQVQVLNQNQEEAQIFTCKRKL
jgi:hypothetical protein